MTVKNKWAMLAFLCAIFVLYAVDRAMLGLLAVPIQEETGLSNVKFGVLSTAIFWTYAVCVPFSGLAGDRFNRARIVGIAAVAWSLMTLFAGFLTDRVIHRMPHTQEKFRRAMARASGLAAEIAENAR